MVASGSALAVGKTVDHTNGLVGTFLQFQLSLTNVGPLAESNIVVQDILPPSLRYVSSTAGPGSTYNTISSNWSISLLPVGGAASLSLAAQIVGSGLITNTATIINSSPPNTNFLQNSARVTVFSLPTTGLAVLVNERNAEGRIVGPLAGATVQVPGVGSGATDIRGLLQFTNVTPATYAVTVTNAGFYPVTHTVLVAKGQMPLENFDLLKNSGPGAPSEFDFSSPQGSYFIPAMPGNLTFSHWRHGKPVLK